MCSNNIICIPVRYGDKYKKFTKNLIEKLTNEYVKTINNKIIKKFVIFNNRDSLLWSLRHNKILIGDINSGISDLQIKELQDTNIKNRIICFDLDYTLHKTQFRFDYKSIDDFINNLNIHNCYDKVGYRDIGELLFGGHKRLDMIDSMFKNLNNTIGVNNIYIITRNTCKYIVDMIYKLYNKLFKIKFKKKNIIQVLGDVTKFDKILEIKKQRNII